MRPSPFQVLQKCWYMLWCAILFCTFPETQCVRYRKNQTGVGWTAFSSPSLEKTLVEMRGKLQGLSYFCSFSFLFIICRGKNIIFPPCSVSTTIRGQEAMTRAEDTLVCHAIPQGYVHLAPRPESGGEPLCACMRMCVSVCPITTLDKNLISFLEFWPKRKNANKTIK